MYVCRGIAKAWVGAYFGAGSGRVLLDEVSCTGNELSIEQCPKTTWGEHNCDHTEDAGVSCIPLTGTNIYIYKYGQNLCEKQTYNVNIYIHIINIFCLKYVTVICINLILCLIL